MATNSPPNVPSATQAISDARGRPTIPWYTWFQTLTAFLPGFPLAVADGGTGDSTLTAHGVLIGEGTNPVAAVAPPVNSGIPLIGQAGADPVFGAALVPGGGTGQTILTANDILIGNGTSAVAFLAPGSAGNLPISNGTSWIATDLISPPPFINAGALGTTTFQPAGLVSNQISLGGIGNGANTTNDILFTATLSANSLDAVGRCVVIEAFGMLASNGNNKTIQIVWGGFIIATTGVITTNGGTWFLTAKLVKSSSGAQTGYSSVKVGNATIATSQFAESVADTSPIVMSVTGASPTTGAANDVTANSFSVEFFN